MATSIRPRDRPSRDLLRKIALGRTVRIEDDLLVGSEGERGVTCFCQMGTLLNAEMLKKVDAARIDVTRQFVREEEFKGLEADARSASLGIWVK